jgi:hypothetical protein
VNVTDPRDLDDVALLRYWLFGNLPNRPGARAIALRMLQVDILTVAIIAGVVIGSVAILLVWAANLPKPA